MSAATAAVVTDEVSQEVTSVPLCEHVRDNGRRCGSPALRGRHFCYHHSRVHQTGPRLGSRHYRAPLPETIESLQLLIMHVTEALGSGRITDKVAGKLLYAVQLSTNLLKMSGAPFKPSVGLSGVVDEPIVTEISPAMEEVLAAQTAPSSSQDEPNEPLVADDDPEMPVTVEEAQRLLLPARLYIDHMEYLDDADPACKRYQATQRRIALHRRAFRILDDHGLIPHHYLDELGNAGVLATHRRETREKAEARIIHGNAS